MRRNLLIALLLMLPTLPALAEQADSTIFSQTRFTFKIVQVSPEERRALRERWEEASPEERVRMRQFFQDRLRQLPTPAQEAIRIPFPDTGRRDVERDNRRGRDANRNPERYVEPDSRFGFGYEKRQYEEDRPEYPVLPGNRRQRDD